jgi:hypothetical protein
LFVELIKLLSGDTFISASKPNHSICIFLNIVKGCQLGVSLLYSLQHHHQFFLLHHSAFVCIELVIDPVNDLSHFSLCFLLIVGGMIRVDDVGTVMLMWMVVVAVVLRL